MSSVLESGEDLISTTEGFNIKKIPKHKLRIPAELNIEELDQVEVNDISLKKVQSFLKVDPDKTAHFPTSPQ